MTLTLPAGLSIEGSKPAKRVPRRPQHDFHLKHKPYQIQPFMIAPVLAGETMKNLLFQARAVSDPLRNRLIGWHLEHYFFYVKLTDLADRDDIKEMLMDMTATGVDTDATADTAMYHFSGINWSSMCLDRIVDEYFRDEGETTLQGAIDGMPTAKISKQSWLDSTYITSEIEDDTLASTELPINMTDLESKIQTWEFMRNAQMTELSFEDYLKTFGVNPAQAEESYKPELIRYVKNWTYPSNTIDASDGSAASACSWSVAERADKDRFFKEPGFLFGVTVARPKVYMSNQRESASHLLDDAFAWLPAVMKDKVETSIKQVTQATGPLGGLHTTTDYWVDVRDLFMYGDQFVNFALTETDMGLVAQPSAAHKDSTYVSEADCDDLFVDEVGTAQQIEQDGTVQLNILGTQLDHT